MLRIHELCMLEMFYQFWFLGIVLAWQRQQPEPVENWHDSDGVDSDVDDDVNAKELASIAESLEQFRSSLRQARDNARRDLIDEVVQESLKELPLDDESNDKSGA